MMAQAFERVTADRLQIREGGGAIAVFGLPFFIAGLLMLLSVLGLLPWSSSSEFSRNGRPVLLLMGTIFTAIGSILVFGRSWTTLDIAQRIAIKQLGLVVRFWERTFRLDDYSAVSLGFVRGDSDSSDRFSGALKGRAGADLSLRSFGSYERAWQCAAAVAQHIRMDLEDASTDHPISLPYAEVNGPLRPRASSPRADVPRPAGARTEVSREADEVRIAVPGPRMSPIRLIAGLIPLPLSLLGAWWLTSSVQRIEAPPHVTWIFLAFVAAVVFLPALSVLNAVVKSHRGGTIVLVSPAGVRIQQRGTLRTRTLASIDASEIVDVDYSTRQSAIESAKRAAEQRLVTTDRPRSGSVGPRTEWLVSALAGLAQGRGLMLKTRRGLFTFGEGLDDEETRYLHSVIRAALDR
jgi:hypothetical protein